MTLERNVVLDYFLLDINRDFEKFVTPGAEEKNTLQLRRSGYHHELTFDYIMFGQISTLIIKKVS